MIRALILWMIVVLPGYVNADTEQIVLGLSHDEVAITATFNGTDILIFGAVKRDAPIPQGSALQVVITVSGPLTPVTVRHKERRYGIWVNTESVVVDAAPSFYAVATTGPLQEVLSETEDLRRSISIPRAIRSIGAAVENSADYTDALIRIRAGEGQYQVLEGAVDLEQQTLFRTQVALQHRVQERVQVGAGQHQGQRLQGDLDVRLAVGGRAAELEHGRYRLGARLGAAGMHAVV